MTGTPGVDSYVPRDWRARNAAAFGTRPYEPRQPFDGHPMGVLEADLEPPLGDLADADEAPAATLAETVSGLAADVAELQGMAHQHDEGGM